MEFAVLLPLLLLIVFGIIQVGRALSQVTWVNQASYQVALLGATTLGSEGPGKMEHRAEKLITAYRRILTMEHIDFTHGDYDNQSAPHFARAAFQGGWSDVFPVLGYPMTILSNVVAPYLYMSASSVKGAINGQTNPESGKLYACGGQQGGSSSSCSKIVCSCSAVGLTSLSTETFNGATGLKCDSNPELDQFCYGAKPVS